MNQRPKVVRRAISGVVLLDKPSGLTSNQALQRVKRMYRAEKAGHTGSLDPLASGLLPLCLGEATKVSAYLLDADKTYLVGARFGARTDTADADGEVIETCAPPSQDPDALERALDTLRGPISQIPPMYSALKHEGQRLYKLARAGEEVERKPRPVTIHELKALGWEDAQTLSLEVHCSKGTYVRTLVEDLGRALGSCAHVVSLRRIHAGPYRIGEQSVTLDTLETVLAEQGEEGLDTRLLPTDSAIADWPKVTLGADAAWFLRRGQAVIVPKAPVGGLLRLYGPEEQFLGIGEIQEDGRVAPKRLIATPSEAKKP